MEPFGLLNFIKSALSLAAEQPPAAEPAHTPDPPPQKQTAEPKPVEQEQEKANAFSAFVEKHERMAKKFRR